jgi:hypothetical protein
MGDGTGKIDMDTDAVAEAGRRLQTTGDTLRSQWVSTAATIVGLEPGIGHGRLADAFGPTYRPMSSKVRANADTIPPWFTELSSATSISADAYTLTDADVANQFRALTGSPVGDAPPGAAPAGG